MHRHAFAFSFSTTFLLSAAAVNFLLVFFMFAECKHKPRCIVILLILILAPHSPLYNIEFTVTLLPHTRFASILVRMASPSDSHTIAFVLSKFIFSPLLSNALLRFRNLFFRPSIVSLISTKSSLYKIFFIKPSLAFSVTTSTTIANNKGDKTDL